MEDLIKKFLSIDAKSDGDGSGSGSGSGDGSGYGSSYGSVSGSGDGSGSGSGDGSGDGSGYGSGYGSSYGSVSGSGDGSSYGSVSGSVDGSGSGSGSKCRKTTEVVSLSDYSKGFLDKDKKIASFSKFNGKPVYYVDNIPCIFVSIKRNMATVLVIKDDMSTDQKFIAKSSNLFAHGDTKEEALQSVNDKFYSSLSFKEKKQEFLKSFKANELYDNSVFYNWHHFLTGSCESGRRMFAQSKGIDLSGKMSTLEFLNLTYNEYNGTVIKEILQEITSTVSR